MKKLFLTLTMLLFAFMGTMRAQSLTVCDGTATNGYVPVYGFYADAYNKCEMVYPADSLSDMAGGTINSMTFYASESSVSWGGASFQVFLAEVADATITSFAGPGTVVYEGSLAISENQMVVTFDTPYSYGGGNLLVGFYQPTLGAYVSSTWKGATSNGSSISGYNYSDMSAISPTGRNFLPKATFAYEAAGGGGGASTAFSTTPDVLDLGYRPNGAWMAPYVFNLKSNVGAVTVNALDFSGNYFTYNAELPATVSGNNPLEVAVSTGTADEGEVNSTITVLYSGNNRDAEQLNIKATAYNPVEGDVWENAIEVPAMEPRTPYETELPEMLYKNYDLPDGTEYTDAVYKMTFDQDVLLFAGASSDNASAFLYTENFEGEGGPMADNNYEYNGPQVNPGPTALWFSYPYTGTNTWYGTSAGGGFYFGYKISTALIAANDLAGLTITQVEAAAREAYPYYCYIYEGGADPSEGNLIGMGAIENPEALYFFDINLEVPAYISGNDDIWVIFYSDSPYAAYCGRYPVSTADGKIWTYNPNASSPAWSSNTNYTPVIYARMLELPTGREVTMDLASMTMPKGNGTVSEIAEADGTVQGVSHAKHYIEMTRDLQTLLNEGFEGGSIPSGWTVEGNGSWHVGSGDYSSSTGSATGTYNALITHSTTGNQTYFITPEMDLSNATSATLSCNYINRSWAGDTDGFGIYYRVNGGAWNELFSTTTAHGSWTASGDIALTGLAANYQIGFKQVDNYGYGVGLDDVVVTADITSGGGGDEPTPYEPYEPGFATQIDGMYVPAGTYYAVFASDVVRDVVNMAYAEVPAPDPAIIVAPTAGELVEEPYLAEWVLGNYTEEFQVLCGTQYPPTTVMIDWTDYLVPSAFLTNLENNKNYFLQVNARNAAGETKSEVVGFHTAIDPVEGFAVVNDSLYPGDAAEFSWEANSRTLIGYNLYKDGELVNVEGPITGTEYAVEDLEYNMAGYAFQITAVYGAGESVKSDPIIVKMTGTGTISGHVYDAPNGYDPEDPDQSHPVANLPVFIIVQDEYGQVHSDYEAFTDENGFYTAEVLTGIAIPGISYQTAQDYGYAQAASVQSVANVSYQDVIEGMDIYTHEYYYPLGMITATEQTDENNVLVEWDWNPAELVVDFETGDFSQAEFTLPAQYAWAVTTTNPHEGTYCMKSTCEGIASATSSIEVTVEVPYDGLMGFWVRVSSESNYDKFHFYIDGVEQGAAMSGELSYQYKEYAVTAGTHTYKWEYTKDSSVNNNDDCVYVDDIKLYCQPAPPIPGATVYDFEDQTMMGWTSLDANNDGYGWVSSADPGQYHSAGVTLAGSGHNASQGFVLSGSYSNSAGIAITPDNYLVSPTQISVEDGALISFYACAQDAGYPAEHFGVAVSTSTATAANFTMVQEWTMTSKGIAPAEDSKFRGGNRAQGNWYEYSVDLSSYAGQDIWVAIRHFNCNDQFILNVDDITLADGSAKQMARNERTFQSFNLYRRDIKNGEDDAEVELIATPAADVFSYIDNEWNELEYGMWQWGIQATYEGYAVEETGDRTEYTYDFEGGLNGWTGIVVNTDGGEWIHSNNNLGGYDYTTLAHGGTGFAMCYSYVDDDGAYDTDALLVSPQSYSMDANSNIHFYADNANDSYPENFSVWVSTAANPTSASDFTEVWSGGAKGTGSNGAVVRHADNRYENWREHTIDLSAYAGQTIWIAFRDVNYDAYEIWIDDVTITAGSSSPTPVPPTPGPTGTGLSEILWSNMIEKDMISNVTFNLALNNGQSPAGAVITLVAADEEEEEYEMDETGTMTVEVRKGAYALAIELDGYYPVVDTLAIDEDEEEFSYVLEEIIAVVENLYVSPTGWAMWEGGNGGGVTPGPGPQPGNNSFTEGFEGGLNGWNVLTVNADGGEWLHSSEQPYGHDYSELAHSGTGFAMCYSFVDYTGAFDTDSYLYTPQKYAIQDGSTLSFWADNANDSYPENFSVCVATADNPTAADFTQVWSGGAKGTGSDGAMVRHQNNRYENWRSHSIDLSAYAGQEVYIAFHDVNYDAYEIWIDDVELGVVNKGGDRAPLSYKVKLDGQFVGETEYPYFQHDVEGMEEGSTHVTAVVPVYATGMPQNAQGEILWQEYEWTYTPCDNYAGVDSHSATVNGNNVTLNWTIGDSPLPPTPPTPGQGQWYYYDNGNNDNNIGAGGAFYWAIMFPAGSYTGDYVTKVATYDAGDAGYAFTGTATIYQGGTTAPGTAVGTVNVATTGATPGFVEYEFAEPVNIDDSQNLWVVFYNETSTSYCAAAYEESGAGDPNARWVSLDGSSWMDLATAGVPGYGWMLRVYVAEGTRGEVHEITVPTHTCNNAGVLSAVPATRGRSVIYEPHFVTDPGAMANGADASWIKGQQGTWGPNCNNGGGYKMADDFTLDATTTITEIEVYGYQTGSTTTSTFTGLYAQIYDGAPNAGGQVVWGDAAANIMTGTSFTNCYRGSNGETTATTRPIMAVTASNLNIELPAGTYYLVWSLAGSASSGPWAAPEATPSEGNTGNGLQYSSSGWSNLMDGGANTPYGAAFKLVGEGGNPNPNPNPGGNGDIIGVYIFRDGELIAQKGANETTYVDENVEGGYHSYCVRVVYDDYAMSCPACDEVHIQYEGVAEDNIFNAIYPNPTSSKVTIEAKDMNHITVVSTLGQVVYDADVDADQIELNLGQYNAGLYLVRVSTANGVSVKRVTVVR